MLILDPCIAYDAVQLPESIDRRPKQLAKGISVCDVSSMKHRLDTFARSSACYSVTDALIDAQ